MNAPGKRWLAFAREDLRVAELSLDDELYNQVCFHAQQCIEKVLKGLLTHYKKTVPRTHAIGELLAVLPEKWFDDLQNELLKMDNYYIPTRYPDALPGTLPEGLPGKKEAVEALAVARQIFDQAEHFLETDAF
ncbi:MAG: HEPN domain-containing protein [Chloroflexi bacterium]|nr:MAG: HEPN domain-containing protein [Chloroflexota bacterium]